MSQNIDSEEVKRHTCLRNPTWPWCDTCFRSQEDGETGRLNLGDGRELCPDCSSIAVTNSDECSFIVQSVFEFYKILNLKVDEEISIFFVDGIEMNRLNRLHSKGGAPDTGRFVPSIGSCLKFPRCRLLPDKLLVILLRFMICRIQTIEKYWRSGGDIKKVVKFSLGHTIILLFGKPDIEMGEILAHEMMHAWLRLQGLPWRCEKTIEEGICQVMSYKWLQWFSSNGLDNSNKTIEQVQHTRELKDLLIDRIRFREDEVYGQGFRDAMRAIKKSDFQTTLNHVAKNGTLPPMTDSIDSTTYDRDEIHSQGFRDATRAVEIFGLESTLHHAVNHTITSSTAPSTTTVTTTTKSTRKTTKQKAIGATVMHFISNAATTFVVPRVGLMGSQLAYFVICIVFEF